jgi:hypothetical protein
MVQRLWFALIVLTILFTAANLWTQQSTARQLEAIAVPGSRSTSVIDSVTRALPAHNDDWADPRVDLNGNEIDDAVSDYRVDRRGEMYERHAPDTALLRLSAPQL